MTDVDLSLPTLLDCRNRPAPPPFRAPAARPWRMPPPALSPVKRAIGRGHDTFGKLRKSLGRRYDDKEIRKALTALVRSGQVVQTGRRYTLVRAA